MRERSLANMKQVLLDDAYCVTLVYIQVGFFGYVTWAVHADVDKIAQTQNILLAPY